MKNRNAIIQSRITRNGKLRTETAQRDAGEMNASVSTHPRNESTVMFLDFPESETSVRLTGHQARTLYRLLNKHYEYVGN